MNFSANPGNIFYGFHKRERETGDIRNRYIILFLKYTAHHTRIL